MGAFLRAGAFTVASVLSGRYRFTIPAYQRPYAWSTEQVEQLLDDAAEAMDRARGHSDREADKGYFLGSIVLHKREDAPEAEVVDGQQRLLSLTIIFAVLRDRHEALAGARSAVAGAAGPHVLPRDRDRAFFHRFVQAAQATTAYPDGWQPDDILGADAQGGAAAPAQTEADEEAFLSLSDPAGEEEAADEVEDEAEPEDSAPDAAIAEGDASGDDPQAAEPLSDSLRNFILNRDAVRRWLCAPRNKARAADLCRFLLERCYLVVVEVPHGDQAHRVFSVLHTRGLDLSDTDVLKAEVMAALPDRDRQRRHRAIWERWEDQLGRDDFERLFSHLRMIARKTKQQLSVAEELRKSYPLTSDPAGFLTRTLAPMAEALHQIRSCRYASPQAKPETLARINRCLRYLSWVPNDAWAPAAMAYLTRYRADPERVARFLAALERLAYALMILKKNDNERIARYGLLLEAIEQDRELATDAGTPLTILQRDRAIILRRLNSAYFGDENWCLAVMKRLDAEYIPLGEPLPDYDATGPKRANVEHVLPKSIPKRSQWLRLLNKKNPADFVHRIGNLIVLSKDDNDAVGNMDFREKCKVYFAPDNTSPFGLKQAIQNEPTWTPAVIVRRSHAMIAELVRAWDLHGGGKSRRRRR